MPGPTLVGVEVKNIPPPPRGARRTTPARRRPAHPRPPGPRAYTVGLIVAAVSQPPRNATSAAASTVRANAVLKAGTGGPRVAQGAGSRLADDAACDTSPRVAGGLRLEIVRILVHDDAAPDDVGAAGADRDAVEL